MDSIKLEMLAGSFQANIYQFDESFIKQLFQLSLEDTQIQTLIIQNSFSLLQSTNNISIYFFEELIHSNIFHELVTTFFIKLLQNQLQIAIDLELHIVSKIWCLDYQKYCITAWSDLSFNKIITFLCCKLRSLNNFIRLAAMKSFYQLLKDKIVHLQKQTQKNKQFLKEITHLMISKEILVKEVSFTRGIFLQALEDELNEVRTLCLKCLALLKNILDLSELKTLVIYMLNDEHEKVREEALLVIKQLKDMWVGKEDIGTMLMCLKEKEQRMRWLVYEGLGSINFTDLTDIFHIVEKVNETMLQYKSDKHKAYELFDALGKTFPDFIGKNCSTFYNYSDQEEPNWKNIIYKGRVILLYPCWLAKLQIKKLPYYFATHALYIQDVEHRVYQKKEHSEKSQELWLNLSDEEVLLEYLQSQINISSSFQKELLIICLHSFQGQQLKALQNSIHLLSITYHTNSRQQAILRKASQALTQPFTTKKQHLFEVIQFCREKTVIEKNKCLINKYEKNTITANNHQPFISRIVFRCFYSPLLKAGLSKQQNLSIWIRLKDLELQRDEDTYAHFIFNCFDFVKIECFLIERPEVKQSHKLQDLHSLIEFYGAKMLEVFQN